MHAADLPRGDAPAPLPLAHFPSRQHAFVWRNWQLVPLERLAHVLGATPDEVRELGRSLGLSDPPAITANQRRRSHISVIKRNWHLLPYAQLLELLGCTADELDYALREDDFLFIKLGRLKPACEPLRYAPPSEAEEQHAAEIAGWVRAEFGATPEALEEPLFGFVETLSQPPPPAPAPESTFSPRYCYSYFALYGDPLLDADADPYPDGYLARLAQAGADGVWLQAVLYKLAPFPWDAALSARWEERLENLRALIARARRHGIGIYLYLNEPRRMPLAFFEGREGLRGVARDGYGALCTSVPEVRDYLRDAVAGLCRAAPELAGFFSITASENPTNCWSHHRGEACECCGPRGAAAVIAEVNATFQAGIEQAGSAARLIAWDWGWRDEDALGIIERLPPAVALMSVSEWNLPIERGGVAGVVGEYSLSAVGPGPRARRHWQAARERGLSTLAKIQAGNTWELSAVPYLPVLENLAETIANLRDADIEGLMLSWTLGGYPSPNMEVVAEMGRAECPTPAAALTAVATRRYGEAAAPAVVRAWQECSRAFREFPYRIGVVYNAPLQTGPANLLWERPTGYRATMVGFPYDDLDAWRSDYPPEVFIQQLERVASGFEAARSRLHAALADRTPGLSAELRVMEAAEIHFQSVANQARFVLTREQLAMATTEAAQPLQERLATVLRSEGELARRLWDLQRRDSRLGFEASNQYFYVPLDLVEKALNCRDLLERMSPP